MNSVIEEERHAPFQRILSRRSKFDDAISKRFTMGKFSLAGTGRPREHSILVRMEILEEEGIVV